MNNPFRILIADRNRHVREFLRREFSEAGLCAQTARDGHEIMTFIDDNDPPDILILDLEIPQGDGMEVLKLLQKKVPSLPIVIHSFLSEDFNQPCLEKAAAVVEKKGDTDLLKETVIDVLKKYYPERFNSGTTYSASGEASPP